MKAERAMYYDTTRVRWTLPSQSMKYVGIDIHNYAEAGMILNFTPG